MSEEAVRQTRSQKRALERDVVAPGSPGGELDIKKVKLESSEQPSAADGPIALMAVGGGDVVKTEQAAKVASISILKTDEVKATIKVEVQTGDGPVDMSTSKSDLKKERQPLSPNNDVIVLSDNEPSSPVMNGLNHFRKTDTDLLMKSRPDERECIIKQLMEELRLQEAKLVLLKKLRQSQTQKESTVQKPTSGSVATPPPLVRGSMTSGKGVLQVSSVRSSGTVIPPPLVRGGQHVPSKQNSQTTMPPLVRGAQVTYTLPIAVSPQQIASLRQQQQQHSGSGPPPLLLAPRASVPNVQVQGQRIIQQGLIRVANVPNTNVLVNIPQGSQKGSSVTSQAGMGSSVSTVQANESPAARQAAAKLALRKQLEKTLLDIPPPKPPAPEFNFLPSAANNEFIYLVGLEEVVQNLLDTLGRGKQQGQSVAPETPFPKEPHTCAQCKTDFTSRWRSEKSGPVLCDHCMSSNLKKALKAEHTNRLKAAFVKALQQEQEIEQRILHQAASPVSKTPSSSSGMKSEHQQHVLVSQQYKQARAQLQQQHRGTPVARHHSSIKQSPGQLSRSVQQAVGSRGVSHSFPTSSQQLQNAVTAAALASRPGKHAMRPGQGTKGSSSNPSANPNAWRKQTTGNSGVTMAYVNPSLSVNKTTTSANLERQREYLLDMIPSRSISQTANTWK
ncbi:transcriptional repressor p66-alpha isoform X1 [Oncorhynchus tshawytscha]|uniref:transcriptional repressor p66-alpha isoform X1 n=1 Tax=Oncorhynchus tshawytscha TaxID=74940 RepID=UPI000D09AB97|nr:transcriptional repressor p66-alpha isoform X1 [Oncorhynchus tshawytscha]